MSGAFHFNVLDYVILGIILLSVIVGAFRGFTREAISLITWVVAFFAALKFSEAASGVFHGMIKNDNVRYVVSFIVIFLIVLILGVVINKLIHGLVSTTGFGFFDHLLGFIFGAARGIVLVTIILFAIGATAHEKVDYVKQSQLAPCFSPLVAYCAAYLPAEMKKVSSWMDDVAKKKSSDLSQMNLA